MHITTGTPIVWAGSDYVASSSIYTKTHAISLSGVGSGLAWGGQKANLTNSMAPFYSMYAQIAFVNAPTFGGTVDFYWSSSPSATSGTLNDGGATGGDGQFKSLGGGNYLGQLEPIGYLQVSTDAAPTGQIAKIGTFTPSQNYGMPVVVNNTNVSFANSGTNMYVALVPQNYYEESA